MTDNGAIYCYCNDVSHTPMRETVAALITYHASIGVKPAIYHFGEGAAPRTCTAPHASLPQPAPSRAPEQTPSGTLITSQTVIVMV